MKSEHTYPQPAEESDADRLRGMLSDDALSVDLVAALAGDRQLTTDEEKRFVDVRKSRGFRFYSDLLYSITHQYFPPETAEDLWIEIIHHKYSISELLGRNVGIAVASLDYLSNITTNMDSATLVDEADIEEIVSLSLRDGLTGLFNHTYFYQQIDFEVKRYARYGSLVSLVLIDIDDFKKVNDTYGHREGDRILAAMGKTLMHVARDSDICCRYGGEEFSVILPLTDIREAGAIAHRMQVDLSERLPDGHTVTVSIGVASCGEQTITYKDLVEKADAALYQVKRSGKNRVLVVTDGECHVITELFSQGS
jgi:diguanylate cyclase (GGDEF)-like protein